MSRAVDPDPSAEPGAEGASYDVREERLFQNQLLREEAGRVGLELDLEDADGLGEDELVAQNLKINAAVMPLRPAKRSSTFTNLDANGRVVSRGAITVTPMGGLVVRVIGNLRRTGVTIARHGDRAPRSRRRSGSSSNRPPPRRTSAGDGDDDPDDDALDAALAAYHCLCCGSLARGDMGAAIDAASAAWAESFAYAWGRRDPRYDELLRVLGIAGSMPPEPAESSLLGVCPRCGFDGLTIDPKRGLRWCDRCYLDALGVRHT